MLQISLDELIGNLKVHELIIKKDSEIVKAKGERKSLALKAKKESSDEDCSTSGSDDEEYAMTVRDFKKFFKRRDLNYLIGESPKPPKDKNQRAFIGGSWSDSGEEDDEKAKDETCLMTQASIELFSTYKAYNGGNVIFGSNLRGNIIGKESLNVIFDETPPPSNTSPLVDDDLDEEEAIKVIEKKNLENDIDDETLEIDDVVNIKESRNHPLENVIGNLNQRTLRNKLDENGVVSRNKARLVAKGYNQQEGVDYDETCALDASQYRVNYSLEGQMLIEFVIQKQLFSYTIEESGQILGIPYNGTCSFSNKWSLDDLQYSVPTSGPYQTDPPCSNEIKNYVQEEREGPVTRIRHDKVIDVEET
ncbi:hypothetical protein Tco_1153598 [Tanacetum coccineum]